MAECEANAKLQSRFDLLSSQLHPHGKGPMPSAGSVAGSGLGSGSGSSDYAYSDGSGFEDSAAGSSVVAPEGEEGYGEGNYQQAQGASGAQGSGEWGGLGGASDSSAGIGSSQPYGADAAAAGSFPDSQQQSKSEKAASAKAALKGLGQNGNGKR